MLNSSVILVRATACGRYTQGVGAVFGADVALVVIVNVSSYSTLRYELFFCAVHSYVWCRPRQESAFLAAVRCRFSLFPSWP